MDASPNPSAASSDNECESLETTQLIKMVETRPELLQKEVFQISLRWLNRKEEIIKIVSQIDKINNKENENFPRSARTNFELRLLTAAKEMCETESKGMLGEVNSMKKQAQERLAESIVKATDLNITAKIDTWMQELFKDYMAILQTWAINISSKLSSC